MDKKVYIYSGEFRFCEIGIETKFIDEKTREHLFTGDIVLISYYDNKTGRNECEREITAVVKDDFICCRGSDGKTVEYSENGNDNDPFVMGIKDADICDLNDGNCSTGWYMNRVKSYKDVVPGEHWGNFRFNYR